MRIVALLIAVASATSLDPLHKVLLAAHADAARTSKDQFSPSSVDTGAPGKSFSVRVGFESGDSTGPMAATSPGFFTYHEGTLKFVLTTQNLPGERRGTLNNSRLFYIGHRLTRAGSFTGKNSYGVRARVSTQTVVADALAFVERPQGDLPAEYEQMSSDLKLSPERVARLATDYVAEFRLSPSEARAMSVDVEAEVDGKIADLATFTGCHDDAVTPTIDTPLEALISTCWAFVDVERIILRRKSTGQVLKTWSLKPPS